MKPFRVAGFTPLAALLLAMPAHAVVEDCFNMKADAERLACYDRESGRNTRLALAPPEARPQPVVSPLSERWELDPPHKTGTFQFRYYKPIYILAARWTDDVNGDPYSPTRGAALHDTKSVAGTDTRLDSTEAKFQISFKVKMWENMVGDNGDLWMAYTQQSHWQLYNKAASSPFRETNYAPELINSWRTSLQMGGVKMSLLNLGLVHQSNGRANPLSRSWNRIYAQAGFEAGDLAVLVRPWYRLKEDADKDDNPDIENYVGRGDLTAIYQYKRQEFSMIARHSLRGGDESRGSVELNWAFPIYGNLRGHVQAFTGYGESLIDYNHRQTTFGLGISLAEWL
ncbi:phospholipase A [Niveibacterium umoris]|uniref:Phospholipase A1 n=1 Tax=Niveibacterium umoris TaxID=1193620 RepID=A0A840BQ59_9RHOO|nr:phospholipase A [Niveibacterium umoris]MBB4014814.1 phospholipase A1 [Niveibacterium umoris]